jgi:hypothetical protein
MGKYYCDYCDVSLITNISYAVGGYPNSTSLARRSFSPTTVRLFAGRTIREGTTSPTSETTMPVRSRLPDPFA